MNQKQYEADDRDSRKDDALSTEALENILKQTGPKELDRYLEQNADSLLEESQPFTRYFRQTLRKKNRTQREVFMTAGISDSYGYKVVSLEKVTRNRDLIIRLCLAAHMELREVNRALKLYGMTPLYAKIPRDAALIIAFNRHIYDMGDADAFLTEHGFEPLYDYEEEG